MKLAIIVIAHRGPEQVALLLRALRHSDIRVYLHLDRRAQLHAFQDAVAGTGVDNVTWLDRRRTGWGTIELVDAILDGLARATADGCDYFMLISGQDFPLCPAADLLEFVSRSPHRSYLAYWPFPRPAWRFDGRDRTDFYTYSIFGRRETCIPRGEDVSDLSWKGRALNELLRLRTMAKPTRRFPEYARPFTGELWWNLSRSAAEHVLRFVGTHADYRAYHRYTSCLGEVFFHGILLGTDFSQHQEIVNDCLRFIIWRDGEHVVDGSGNAQATHPQILREHDFAAMVASGKLFARKFDSTVDATVLQRLAEYVRR